ncbi:hypothetical protein GCM10009603_49760 [Nocardiopsis exhalans]
MDAMRELYASSPLFAVKPGPGGVVGVFSPYVDGDLDEEIKAGLIIRFAEPLLSPPVGSWPDSSTDAMSSSGEREPHSWNATTPRRY